MNANSKVLIGLGNPGSKYERTRHNFGFLILDRLIERWQSQSAWDLLQERREPKLFQMQAWQRMEQEGIHQVTLVWPWTFMNRSGEIFAGLPQFPDPPGSSVLVIVDDLSLPLGQMRLRSSGSAGGHNGLKSIEAALGSQEYSRLRLGIGHPGSEIPVVEYVLCPFDPEELSAVEAVTEAAAQAVERWLCGEDFTRVVQWVNGWRLPQDTKTVKSEADSEVPHGP